MASNTRVTNGDMAPVTSVRSIRLPLKTWAALVERAEKEGISVNALVGRFVDAGLKPAPKAVTPAVIEKVAKLSKPANAKLAEATASPPKVNVPFAGDIVQRPYQKGSKK